MVHYDHDFPSFADRFIEWAQSNGVFVIGICYRRQLMVVWMSHGDEATRLPHGFEVVAMSQHGVVASFEDNKMRFYRLQCHHGYKERERVVKIFERDLHLPFTCIDASNQFLSKLKMVVDPKMKRMMIDKEFISIFYAFAQEIEHKIGKKLVFLVQGTLYPDVIESCSPTGATERAHSLTIKSHHNVGGIPKDMKLRYKFECKFMDDVVQKICNNVRGVNRVLKDFTSKPPSTIEWE
ncbi:hypothetical protein REPUB_Repub06bG0015200 [Reevesia pubescens]